MSEQAAYPLPETTTEVYQAPETKRWPDLKFEFSENNLYGGPANEATPKTRVRACIHAVIEAAPEYADAKHLIAEHRTLPDGTRQVIPESASFLLDRWQKKILHKEIRMPIGKRQMRTILDDSSIMPKLRYELLLQNDPVIQMVDRISKQRGERLSDAQLNELADSLIGVVHAETIVDRIDQHVKRLREIARPPKK